MTDKADEIARELALRHVPGVGSEYPLSDHSRAVVIGNLGDAIAAALRSYGKACRDEGLEEAAVKVGNADVYSDAARHVRSLKSKPEAQDMRPSEGYSPTNAEQVWMGGNKTGSST